MYSDEDVDYSKRAAEYISEQIKARTSVQLAVKEDDEGSFEHEIVVGETSRNISKTLSADTQKTQFAILADENHIATRTFRLPAWRKRMPAEEIPRRS